MTNDNSRWSIGGREWERAQTEEGETSNKY